VKSVATSETVASAVIANALPPRPANRKTTASASATMPTGRRKRRREEVLVVAIHRHDDRPDEEDGSDDGGRQREQASARAARPWRSPTVRSVRNVAPWKAKRRTTAMPANTVYGLNRSQKLPAYSPSESRGGRGRGTRARLPR
jgi:hypothetical protein